MQILFEDSSLESLCFDKKPNNSDKNLPYTQKELIKIVNNLGGVVIFSELPKLGINYSPPENEHSPHSVTLNTELRLYFKQLTENQLLIVKVE